MKGLEPPRLSAPDPKSGTATNYATCADLPEAPSNDDFRAFSGKRAANLGIILTARVVLFIFGL